MDAGEMLFCVNKNNFYHEDAYDGHVYAFPPGEKVMVPLAAAAHMFGVGEADLSRIMQRKGWAFKYDSGSKSFIEDKDALAKLRNFKWTRAKLIESPAEEPGK